MSEPTVDRDPFEVVAESFLARFRAGERPSVDEFVTRHPELADKIRELLPALVMVEQDVTFDRDPGSDGPQPERAPAPCKERRLGDYRILREIGRGGMGVVYEAQQISLGRRVALKVLSGQVSSDRMAQERFRREARAAAKLHHTNIVPVYGVSQAEGVCFNAMQFIEGRGLDALITELRRLVDRAGSQPTVDAASGGRSLWPRGDRPRQASEASTLYEAVEVSRELHDILTGRLNPDSGPAGTSPTLRSNALAGRSAASAGDQTERPANRHHLALTSTNPGTATAGGTTGPRSEHPPTAALSPSASPSSNSSTLPGGTQLSLVESGRRAFFRSLAKIGRQVAGGLAYAHARGIVHRDIKPSNLLLDTEGVVWIADFGLAKEDDEGLTKSGDILGTLRYIAPERFRGEGDARADVYALGLTLYELLTLRPAFASPDRLVMIEQIKTEDPPRPRSVDGRIPRDLETIVLKAIEKDPKARYQTAEAMGEDLRRFLADEPILARQVSALERYWRWARRNPVIAVLGGVLTGVLVLATVSSLLAMERFRTQADTQRTLAAKEAAARSKADGANASLLATQEELRSTVYATRSNLALAAWNAADVRRLRSLLDLLRPSSGEPDLRGWEWRYLWQLAHEERLALGGDEDRFTDRDRLALPSDEGRFTDVVFSPDGLTPSPASRGTAASSSGTATPGNCGARSGSRLRTSMRI
jgi:serine/threonine protein kinase